MKGVKTVVFAMVMVFLSGGLKAQTWQYLNTQPQDSTTVFVLEGSEGDILSISTSSNVGIDESIDIRIHDPSNGNELSSVIYSIDSLHTTLHWAFYNEVLDEYLLLGGGVKIIEPGNVRSYFLSIRLDKNLEIIEENLRFLTSETAYIWDVHANETSNSGYIVVANLGNFPNFGYHSNVFIELDNMGHISRINSTEPVENVGVNSTWTVVEDLNGRGYYSIGLGSYFIDSDFNIQKNEIEQFISGGRSENRSLLRRFSDSSYIYASDKILSTNTEMEIAILDTSFNIVKYWAYIAEFTQVSTGRPLDWVDQDYIYLVEGNVGGLNFPNDNYNLGINQLNSNLELNWRKVFSSSSDSMSYVSFGVTATSDLGAIAFGQVKHLEDNGGWSNANEFIIKFDENGTTPTRELPSGIASLITIFPNPTTDFMTISNDQSRDLEFKIYDVAGRLISTQQMSAVDANITIGTHSLTAGSYILHTISDDRQIDSYQFIKQ